MQNYNIQFSPKFLKNSSLIKSFFGKLGGRVHAYVKNTEL